MGTLAALAALPSALPANDLGPTSVKERLMIIFKPQVAPSQWNALAKAHGLQVLRTLAPMKSIVVQAAPGQVGPAENALKASPLVLHVGRDLYRKWIDVSAVTPESRIKNLDQLFGRPLRKKTEPKEQPAPQEEIQWGVRRVNAPAAWNKNQGSGVKVAIVDTGIDLAHPDLAANVKGGHNAIDKDQPWTDDHFHGTHVAGIVAATLNGDGVAGVAPKAELYGVKVLTKDGSGSLFGIIAGMMWCIENGMQVANMSLGAEQGNFMFQYAVQAMHNGGVTLVAAAGNSKGAVGFPAAYPEAIAVSALDEKDQIAEFSSRGPEVDFIAPGVRVPSTITGGGVKAYSGTSMATPHVTGLAAMAIASGAKGPQGVLQALQNAAQKLPGLTQEQQGAGLIDAAKLLTN